MSDAFNFEGGPGAATAPAAGAPRRVATIPSRHALGMPAGSVRALLAFMVLGLVWGLMAMTANSLQTELNISPAGWWRSSCSGYSQGLGHGPGLQFDATMPRMKLNVNAAYG